ncbi:hypothetical protein C0991_003138, partial [Blastosporella zonata]
MTNYATNLPSSSSSLAHSSPEHEGTLIRPRTLRERCGVTFFIHFEPANLGGPPKGHLQPTVGNLPRRRRVVAVPPPAACKPPVIVDE